MAQFTEYRSTDGSAPTLTGETGKLVALLDAVLVNGYGSKAAAGWTHPFTGSSTKQAYRSGAGTQFYLRVLDDGTMTGGFRDSSVRGGESMSDVDTFTNAFPTAAQLTNGLNWRKSNTADSTARPWVIFADSRTVYLFLQTGDTGSSSPNWVFFAFGDFYSYVPSDPYNCILIGLNQFSAGTINFPAGGNYTGDQLLAGLQAGQVGHYVARISPGTGASTQFYKKGEHGFTATAGTTNAIGLFGVLGYPNSSDGGLWTSPIRIMDAQTPDIVHGEMRGFFHQLHPAAGFGDGDTFGGAGNFSGKSFKTIKGTPLSGVYVLETSNTLNTN